MKKESKVKKRCFGATFTKKGAKQMLVCQGCGEHFVMIPHFRQQGCPYCMCIHYLHVDSLYGWSWKLLYNTLVKKHSDLNKAGVEYDFDTDGVALKINEYLKEYFKEKYLMEVKKI